MIHFFLKTFERILPTIVDTVSVASEELKKKCINLGVPVEKIYDAPVGADLSKYVDTARGEEIRKLYGKTGKIVLYLGQLNGAQYTNLFIEAAHTLKDKGYDVQYLILGTGIKCEELKEMTKRLGVDNQIRFLGFIQHDNVPQYLNAADIAVACFEDNEITRCKSPLKVVEYLAAGKAIVASAVGEVKKMLGGCGILVKPGSSDALARGIEELIKDDVERESEAHLARARAEEIYNWPRITKNLVMAYESSLRKKQENHLRQ